MKFLRKRWRILLALAGVGILFTATGLVLWAGFQIASPTRRGLMDYHREFLAHPTAHGVRIDRFTATDGTPCLVCTPDPDGRIGARGRTIRQQLGERGLVLPPLGTITSNLVLLHGRKGRKEDYLPVAERFCAAGFRCIIPDLPAHGEHPAAIATYGLREANLPARMLDEASTRFAFAPQPAGLVGLSMGGSVAVHSAARPGAPWQALIVISSFDSLQAVIEGQASRYIGSPLGPLWAEAAGTIYRQRSGMAHEAIQPGQLASTLKIPTFIAHGSADPVISMAAGQRLFNALPAATVKQWQEIPGANHDNVLITNFPIYASMAEWMMRHLTPGSPLKP